MDISIGFKDSERELIAQMYWQAFGPKLGPVLGPENKGIAFIRDVLDPTHALCARTSTGTLLGVAGFKTYESALVDGTLGDMARHFGWFGAAWRATVLSLLERDIENERFLMDGIFVHAQARGRGVGTLLLDAIAERAREKGYAEVRLDVIDSNVRARSLYERRGFVAQPADHIGLLRHIFGFKSATPMTLAI